MNKTTNFQIGEQLWVVTEPLQRITAPPATSVDHVFVIDCSGSMSADLPKLRTHIKSRISKILNPTDTFTLIWFSGRDEFGIILENVTATNLRELKSIHDAIDRWLRPVGLTGFLQPLQALAARLQTGNPKNVVFMSDGADNQWPRAQILEVLRQGPRPAASTVVEYGYYADRAFLAQMASTWGAKHVFADKFVNYEGAVDLAVTQPVVDSDVVTLDVGTVGESLVVGWDVQNKALVGYEVIDGKVQVPSTLAEVSYISARPKGREVDSFARAEAYMLIAALAPRMRSDLIWPLLRATGDVAFIEEYANCFGKQAYSAFQAAVSAAVLDERQRLTKGYKPTLVPSDDAFTLLDLLELLANSDTAKVAIDHKVFNYQRIGKQRVDANTHLTDDEKDLLDTLSFALTQTRDLAKIAEIRTKIDRLTNKPEPLEFEATPVVGYSLEGLVLNEDRPNVSFRVKREGFVDISKRVEGTPFENVLPHGYPTFIYRTYTVIRDGIRNMDLLPVVDLSEHDRKVLSDAVEARRLPAIFAKEAHGDTLVFDLTKFPITNGSAVKRASARELFDLEWKKLTLQADLKVYKERAATLYGDRKAELFGAFYGQEAGEWLAEQGITAQNGFNPPTVTLDATDMYLARELRVKLAGYSKLPTVEDVRTRMADPKKKQTTAGQLMVPAVNLVAAMEQRLDADAFKTWLDKTIKEWTAGVRRLQYAIARIKFAVIVGQTWFAEFPTLDDTTLTMDFAGTTVECAVELRETEVKC